MAMMQLVHIFDHCKNVTITSIPGNHGEAVRFGKGVTTYDDSFDVERDKVVVAHTKNLNANVDVGLHALHRSVNMEHAL